MVDFMTVVKGSLRKFQLQAEVALLEREASNRQRAFGVELYDLIEAQRLSKDAQIDRTLRESNQEDTPEARKNVEGFLKLFEAIENEIREPLDNCRKDVAGMEESVPKFPPLFVQRRKEDFGVEIWPTVSKPKWLHESLEHDLKKAMDETAKKEEEAAARGEAGGTSPKVDVNKMVTGALNAVVKGTVTTINKAIGKLSPEQQALEDCLKAAKKDMASVEEKKREKYSEIEALVAGNQTLECCA